MEIKVFFLTCAHQRIGSTVGEKIRSSDVSTWSRSTVPSSGRSDDPTQTSPFLLSTYPIYGVKRRQDASQRFGDVLLPRLVFYVLL